MFPLSRHDTQQSLESSPFLSQPRGQRPGTLTGRAKAFLLNSDAFLGEGNHPAGVSKF